MPNRVPDGRWDGKLIHHSLPRPPGLIEVDEVYDIGAGIRPMNWFKPKRHVCVDAHEPYLERLAERGYETVHATALEFLEEAPATDAIYLLDVIEHMEKDEGFAVIQLAEGKARQLVIYTPFGFMEQTDDGWGMDGDYWQLHRSGWLPEEFPGYFTMRLGRGFYAVLTK